MPRLTRAFLILILTAAAGVFAVSVFHSAGKPFTLDETDIALRAHLINREGAFPKGFVTGAAEALTHPPLYDFTVSVLFRWFGEREQPVRLFGIVCYLIVGLFSSLTLMRLVKPGNGTLWALGGLWAILLLNPLMIQHAMLADADTTGTALCAALLVYGWIRTDHLRSWPYVVTRLPLAAVTAAMFLFKEGTPVLLFSGLAAYRLLNREFKKLLADLVLTLGAGALLAWGIWSAYAHALGMDPARIYQSQSNLRYSLISRFAFLGKVFKALPTICRWPVFWNSAPLVAGLGLAMILRVGRFFRIKKLEPVDLLWLTGMAVWIPFLLIKPSIDMMKYQYPVYPLLFVAGIAGVMESVRSSGAERAALSVKAQAALWMAGTLLATALFIYYFRLGDYILYLFQPRGRPAWVGFIQAYFAPLAILSAVGLGVGLWRKRAIPWLLAGAFAVSLPIQAALDLRQTADYTTAESWMNYGENGLVQTAEYLSSRIRPSTLTCLRKDVRYHLEALQGLPLSKNLDPRDLFRTPASRLADLEDFLTRAPIDYVVTDPVSLLRLPEDRVNDVSSVLAGHFELDRAIGNFRIYRRKISGPRRT